MNGGAFMEGECVKIGSVTYANKARDILKNAGIRSKMKKTINEKDGCSYILEFDEKHFDRVILILRENEISFERCDNY